MKIEFETDINGYHDARKFKLLIDTMLKHDAVDASLKSFATTIRSQLEEFIARPEFSEFAESHKDDRYTASHDESAGEGLSRFVRNIVGPGKRELELSKQRQQLIERAERAEQSAYEALAETSEMEQQRDKLKSQLNALESELEKFRKNS